MAYLKKNIVLIICAIILIVASYYEFRSLKWTALFILLLIFFIGGMTFIVRLGGLIFRERFRTKDILFLMKYEIIVWIASGIILFIFLDTKYINAFLLGLSIYTVFIFGLFWINFRWKKKRP